MRISGMKKTLCVLLLALCLGALLCACGEKKVSEADLSLTVSGTAVRADSSIDALLDAFGGDYSYSEAVSCVYTGMDKTYAYSGLILYTYPDGDTDRLLELYCTENVQTSRGITIGASRKDVEAAYGTGYALAGNTLTYALAAPDSLTVPASLYFELDGDAVCAIGLTSAHRAE